MFFLKLLLDNGWRLYDFIWRQWAQQGNSRYS